MNKRQILKDILNGKAEIKQLLTSRKALTFNLVCEDEYLCHQTGESFTLSQIQAMDAPYQALTNTWVEGKTYKDRVEVSYGLPLVTMYALIDDLDGPNDIPFYIKLPAIEV
jgi:hypothetical protein